MFKNLKVESSVEALSVSRGRCESK